MREEQPERLFLFVEGNTNPVRVLKETGFILLSGDLNSTLKETLFVARSAALSSHVTAQIRVMASLLQSVKSLNGRTPDELDPYWTLMSYFNSLRELGHATPPLR